MNRNSAKNIIIIVSTNELYKWKMYNTILLEENKDKIIQDLTFFTVKLQLYSE